MVGHQALAQSRQTACVDGYRDAAPLAVSRSPWSPYAASACGSQLGLWHTRGLDEGGRCPVGREMDRAAKVYEAIAGRTSFFLKDQHRGVWKVLLAPQLAPPTMGHASMDAVAL